MPGEFFPEGDQPESSSAEPGQLQPDEQLEGMRERDLMASYLRFQDNAIHGAAAAAEYCREVLSNPREETENRLMAADLLFALVVGAEEGE